MQFFYRKEIDFLRAIAVLFVIIYHYFPNFLPKGYLGVDLFFVISGFLISFQIYNQTIKNNFSFKDFYIRRAKRILPVAILTLIVVCFISLCLFTDKDFYSFFESLIYSLFFSSNFFFWLDGGYFGPNDELKPLLHFWSLGIEEQFYIFFPIFFIFLIKLLKNKNILFFIVFLIILLSLGLNIFLTNIGGANPAFFLLPTRVWNLGFGVLAMLILIKKGEIHSNIEAVFFIILILLGFHYELPYLPNNFLIIFSSFMLLRKKLPKNFTLNFLVKNKFFNYIGLISFSLYLWHWPLLVFFKYYFVYEVNIWIKIFSIIIVFSLSAFSYHFVELFFRYKFNFKKLTYILLIIYTFFTVSFLSLNKKETSEYIENSPNFIADASLTNFKCKTNNYFLYNKLRACIINKNIEKNYDLALIGNSHAQMYANSILPHLKTHSRKGIILPMTWCLPTTSVNLSSHCLDTSKKYYNKYFYDKNIKTVIIATSWWHDQLYDGKILLEDKDHMMLSKSLLNLYNQLKDIGKEVYLVSPIQVPLYELPQTLSRLVKFNHIDKQQLSKLLKVNRNIYENNYGKVNEFFKKNLKDNYIDLSNVQCDQSYCYYSNKNGLFFADGSHISKNGAKLFSKKFEKLFK